jgi:hypothetical protein
MKRPAYVFLVITLLVLSSSLLVFTQYSSSKKLQEFYDGQASNTVTFTGAGSDNSTKIHLNTTDRVKSVKFNISNGEHLGEYLRTPSIDIGEDGDQEWAYNDVGYGSWGYQDQFDSGVDRIDVNLNTGIPMARVTLPAKAQVTSAQLQVKGIFDTKYEKHVAAPDGVDNAWSLDSGDIDGDGYEDVVGVENIDGGHLFWYENPQTVLGTWTYHAIDTVFYGYYVKLTDMDNDLDLDIVMTIRSNGGGIKWYSNDNGDGSAWTGHDINMSFSQAGSFTFADVNGNGSEDIVLLADYHNLGRLAWIEKPGNLSHNWTTHIINESVTYMSHLSVFDLDGDTNLDIIMTNDHWTNAAGGIYLFEGPDDPVNETWLGYKITDFPGPMEVSVLDIDLDTHPDIVVANSSYNRVTWFESPDTPFTGAWIPHDMATGISGAKGVELVDMDGDTDLDVLTSAHYGESAYWLEHPSSGVTNPWTGHQVGSGIYDARVAKSIDIDNANQIDVAVHGIDFGQLAGEVESSGSYQQIDIQGIATGSPYFVVAGDFDGENASDVAFISYNGESLCVRRTGIDPTSEWTLDIVDTTLYTPYGLNATDLDKDGDLDLIVCTYYGDDIYWYENRYDTNPSNPWLRRIIVENSPNGNHRNLITGDIDGKNCTDVIVYERWTDSSAHVNNCLVWYEAPADPTNASQSWYRHVIANRLLGTLSYDIADFDDDGYEDIVFTQYRSSGGNFGNISWAQHPLGYSNAKNIWQVRLISIDHEYPVGLRCIKIDHDDTPDIVVSDYYKDTLKWYRTPDDPTLPSGTWDGYHIEFNIPFAWYLDCYDIGHDGRADIVVADTYNDQVLWYTSPKDPVNSVPTDWTKRALDNQAIWSNDVCFGDFSGNGLIDVAAVGSYPGRVYWYDLQPLYSPSALLDVGVDSIVDWTISDLGNTSTSPDLKDAFNTAIAQAVPFADSFGNSLVKVPIMLSGPERNATIFGLDITYDVIHTISGSKITQELNDYLISHNDTDAVDIPIKITASSAGKITFSDLEIELNSAPTLIQDIPDTYSLDEDTKEELLFDMRDYYTDDYTDVNSLVFALENYTNQDYVDLEIYSNTFLSVDATKVENWHGVTSVVVSATDGDGFTTPSNPFKVTINSVNDEPVAGPDGFDDIAIMEGQSYTLNLSDKEYFTDPDGDKLYYDTNIDQQNPNIKGNLTILFDPVENTLNFSASDDWTISGLLLKIYCDDQEDVLRSLSKNLKLDVINILEPLYWKSLPIVNVEEDSINEDVIDFRGYVWDPDHPAAPVSFHLLQYENSSFLDIDLNPGGTMDITTHSNFHGDSVLTLKAENEFNFTTTTMLVVVEPVNDPPVISDLSPEDGKTIGVDSIQLSWNALDVEGDKLEYVLTLEELGGESVTYDLTDPVFSLTGLKDNTTYYWYVTASDGTDFVTSAKMKLTVSSTEAQKYDLDIDCPAVVTVKPGEKKNIPITITNNQDSQNYVTPWIEDISPEISSFVELTEEYSTVYINAHQKKSIALVVDLREFDGGSGDYFVLLNFQNGMNKKVDERNVTVRTSQKSEDEGINALFYLIPIFLIVLLVIIIVALLIIRRRKKEDEESFFVSTEEEEEEKESLPQRPSDTEEDVKLAQDIEDGLSKILESVGVEEEEGVLEPEIAESSPFDEEDGPPEMEEPLEEMPAVDISPIGEEEESLIPEEDLEQQLGEVEEPDYEQPSPAQKKTQTRYSYTYSKRPKRLAKEEDELVELKPLEEEDKPKKKPSKKKSSNKKGKKKTSSKGKKKSS